MAEAIEKNLIKAITGNKQPGKIVSYFTCDKNESEQNVSPTFSEDAAGAENRKAHITYNHPAETIFIRAAKKFFFTNNTNPKEKLGEDYALATQVTITAFDNNDNPVNLNADPILSLSSDKKELSIKISAADRENENIDHFIIDLMPKGAVKGVILHDTKDNGDKDFSQNIYTKTISDLVDDIDSINKFVTQAEKDQITKNQDRITEIGSYFNETQKETAGVKLNVAVPAELVIENENKVFVTEDEQDLIHTNADHINVLEKNFYKDTSGEIEKTYLAFGTAGKVNVLVKAENVEDTSSRRFVTDDQITAWTDQRVKKLANRNDYVQDGVKYAYTAVNAEDGKTKISKTGEADTLVERDQYGQVIAAPFKEFIAASQADIQNNTIKKYKEVFDYAECSAQDLQTLPTDKIYVKDEHDVYSVATAEQLENAEVTKYQKVYTKSYVELSDGQNDSVDEYAALANGTFEEDVYVEASQNAAITSKYFQTKIKGLTDDIYAELARKENLANKSSTIYLEDEEDNPNFDQKYPSVRAVREAVDNIREVAFGKTSTYIATYTPAVEAVEDEEHLENNVLAVDAVNAELGVQDEVVRLADKVDPEDPEVVIPASLLADDGDGEVTNVINKLRIGDVIYLTNEELPDRWVSRITYSYEVQSNVTAQSSIGLYLRSGEEEPYTYTKVESLSDYVKGETYYKRSNAQVELRKMETAKVRINRIDMAGRGELVPDSNQTVEIPKAEPYDSQSNHEQYTGVVRTGNPASTSLQTDSNGTISIVTASDSQILTGAAPGHSIVTVENMDAAVAKALLNNDYINSNSSLQTAPTTGVNSSNAFKEWMHITEVTAVANATSETPAIVPEDPNEATEYPDNDNQAYLKSIRINTGSQTGEVLKIKPVEIFTFPDTDMVKRIAVGNKIYNIQPGRIGYEELDWEE